MFFVPSVGGLVLLVVGRMLFDLFECCMLVLSHYVQEAKEYECTGFK